MIYQASPIFLQCDPSGSCRTRLKPRTTFTNHNNSPLILRGDKGGLLPWHHVACLLIIAGFLHNSPCPSYPSTSLSTSLKRGILVRGLSPPTPGGDKPRHYIYLGKFSLPWRERVRVRGISPSPESSPFKGEDLHNNTISFALCKG